MVFVYLFSVSIPPMVLLTLDSTLRIHHGKAEEPVLKPSRDGTDSVALLSAYRNRLTCFLTLIGNEIERLALHPDIPRSRGGFPTGCRQGKRHSGQAFLLDC